MPIARLPELVVAQIAAGEVVERPSSVVKELLENALDAQATHIAIDVLEGGRRLIRVSDDGTGIHADEVPLALARHATSKLRDARDLYTLETLGFRGEALASIVAVSRSTLRTRHRDEEFGVEIRVEGGEIRSQRAFGAPAGTMLTVENLFFNTPARLKFMKSDNTEKRHMLNLVTDYAMAYPQVRFVLTQDEREAFRSNGTSRLEDVVVKVFGLDIFRQMVGVYGEEAINEGSDRIIVEGFTSLPDLSRNDRSRIVVFVNGRAVQDHNLVYAITQAYHMLNERGKYPYAVLMLRVPPDFVDVNVHPTKAEVRFQDPNSTFVAIQRSVRDVLMRATRMPGAALLQTPRGEPLEIHTNLPGQMPIGLAVPENMSASRARQGDADDRFDYIPDGSERPAKPRTLPPLRVVGQIASTWIVAEGPAGLYLVDQFAASERVGYESLLEAPELLSYQGQILEHATLEVSAAQMRLLQPRLDDLAARGILLEAFGTATVRIRSVPQAINPRDASEFVGRVILAIEQGEPFPEAIMLRVAQYGAFKTGQTLTQEQMQGMIRQLERCPNPLQSPSGKPTLVHMSAEQLTREFTRRS